MEKFEKDFLQQHTPCQEADLENLAEILGTVHAELIIIHPFREGNGRLSRLLANIMAMQAGWPQLNYSSIDQVIDPNGFDNYIKSIHAAFAGNVYFIKEIFLKILKDSTS
jgi:cell filamentation protein